MKVCPVMSTPEDKTRCIEHECAWFRQVGDSADFQCAQVYQTLLLTDVHRMTQITMQAVDKTREINEQVIRSKALGEATDELKSLVGLKKPG